MTHLMGWTHTSPDGCVSIYIIRWKVRFEHENINVLLTRSLVDWTIYVRNTNFYLSMKIFTYLIEIAVGIFENFYEDKKIILLNKIKSIS